MYISHYLEFVSEGFTICTTSTDTKLCCYGKTELRRQVHKLLQSKELQAKH